MPTRKTGQTNIRKITKVGKASLGITLPIDLVRKLKWRDRQRVVVKKQGSKLIISDWRARPTRPSKLQRSGKRHVGGKK